MDYKSIINDINVEKGANVMENQILLSSWAQSPLSSQYGAILWTTGNSLEQNVLFCTLYQKYRSLRHILHKLKNLC